MGSGDHDFDTADAYGGGRSETYSASGSRRDGPTVCVLTTKTFNPMDEGADRGLAPARVRRQLDSSLQRLGVERVDLYLDARVGPRRPDRRDRRRLRRARRGGKIGAYGVSNVDGARLREAFAAGVAWVQNSYSLLDREAEGDVLPLCRGARARVHAVQPARGRLADRQVPPW